MTIGRTHRRLLIGAASTLLLAAGLSWTAQATPANATDFVTNGTFESGTATGWSGASMTVTTADAHSGTYSLGMTGPFDITDAPDSISYTQTGSINWARVDLWVKGPAGDVLSATLRQYTSTIGDVSADDHITLTGGWDHLVGTPMNVYQNGPSIDFHLNTVGAVGSADQFFMDDVHIFGGESAAPCGAALYQLGGPFDTVKNCSFEDPFNLDYWNNGSDGANSTLSIDSTVAHTGTQSAKLVANVAGTITLNDTPDYSRVYSVGTTCTATAWVYSGSGHGQVRLRFREYSSTKSLVGTTIASLTPTAGTWQQISVTRVVAAQPDTLDLTAYATGQSAGDTLNVDDVHQTCA